MLLAAGAQATTYCVPAFHAACPDNGSNVAQANLETAMQSNGTDAQADKVIVRSNYTYTDADTLNPTGTDPLTVRGGGPSTELTSSATGNVFVVNLGSGAGRPITMRDLTILIPSSFPDASGAGIQVSGDSLIDVDIISENPQTDAAPSWVGGGVFRRGKIAGRGGGSIGAAFRVGGTTTGPLTVEDATLEKVVNGLESSTATPVAHVRRTTISTDPGLGQTAFVSTGGSISIENSLIIDNKGTPLYVLANTTANATIDADGLTIVDRTGVGSAALISQSTAAGNAALSLAGSIAHGFAFSFIRQATAAGSADVGIDHSNITPTSSVSSGAGSGTRTNSIDADPLFVSPSNFRLSPGSPSIDAADPASTLTEDRIGTPRPQDGDGNGSAVADQGAYEVPKASDPPDPPKDKTAPETTITSGPGRKAKKGRPKFRFSANEAATFQCRVAKVKAAAASGSAWQDCSSPQRYKRKRKRKAKRYVFKVRATDEAGNTDQTPAKKKFKVKKRRRKRG